MKDYITDDNERKKERKIKKSSSNAHTREITDFASMTDEQLLAWGEGTSTDWDDPASVADFYGYCDECKQRGTKKWTGKIIKGNGTFEKLRSHDEIMTEMGVSTGVRSALVLFLRNCYANGHLILNETLVDIICRLDDCYGDDEAGKAAEIDKAVKHGYYDISVGKFRRSTDS